MSKENSAPVAFQTDLLAHLSPGDVKDGTAFPLQNKGKQELVALLRAAGWKQGRIARYLGCDKTLRKNIFP